MVYKPHIAKFNGKNNSCKCKVFLLLYIRKQHGLTEGLSASDMARLTGVDIRYLYCRLSKWCKWRYLKRKAVDPGPGNGRARLTYSFDDRAYKLLVRAGNDRLEAYRAEMRAYQGRDRLALT